VTRKQAAFPDLRAIPGVGPSIAEDLRELGYRQVPDLESEDAEQMYERLCALRGERLDRCVLYVFRAATYFAGRDRHDPELLKWWNWTDERMRSRTR
jgi:hypothetical protein